MATRSLRGPRSGGYRSSDRIDMDAVPPQLKMDNPAIGNKDSEGADEQVLQHLPTIELLP